MSESDSNLSTYSPRCFQEAQDYDYSSLASCRLPSRISAEYFRQKISSFPSISKPLPPHTLPSVPFEPLQIAGPGDELIPNKRVLQSYENDRYSIPQQMKRVGALLYDPYMPRLRIQGEDESADDEDLPNYAQSFRTRYDFQLIDRAAEVKEQIKKIDTLNQAWRFKLFQAAVILLKRVNSMIDSAIFEAVLHDRAVVPRHQSAYRFLRDHAQRVAEDLAEHIHPKSCTVEQNLRTLENLKKHYHSESLLEADYYVHAHLKRSKDLPPRKFTEEENTCYCAYIDRAKYYLALFYNSTKQRPTRQIQDAIYQSEHAFAYQIYNQQEEFYKQLHRRNEALNFISKIVRVPKCIEVRTRRHSSSEEVTLSGPFFSKHPNAQPDVYFYNKPPYPHVLPKILTSYPVSDKFMQYLCSDRRLYNLFNKTPSNLQRTAYYLSQFHEFGLFSLIDTNGEEEMTEYCGEIINQLLSEIRDREYIKNGFGSIYMFQLRDDVVIDATFMGSYARFLNHSCTPNSDSYTLVLSEGRLVPNNYKPKAEAYGIAMLGTLVMGQEVTINYNLNKVGFEHKSPCNCGSANCTGHIN